MIQNNCQSQIPNQGVQRLRWQMILQHRPVTRAKKGRRRNLGFYDRGWRVVRVGNTSYHTYHVEVFFIL